MKPNPFYESITGVLASSFFCDLAIILTFFISADMPIRQVMMLSILLCPDNCFLLIDTLLFFKDTTFA